jgi:methanogenic corrinoid protein MtbC1
MLADILRAHGYRVVDLGGNVPIGSFVEAARGAERLVAVGISSSDAGCHPAAADVVAAVHAGVAVPILVGGPATDAGLAAELNADGWAPDGEAAAALLQTRRPPS